MHLQKLQKLRWRRPGKRPREQNFLGLNRYLAKEDTALTRRTLSCGPRKDGARVWGGSNGVFDSNKGPKTPLAILDIRPQIKLEKILGLRQHTRRLRQQTVIMWQIDINSEVLFILELVFLPLQLSQCTCRLRIRCRPLFLAVS